MNLPMVQEYIMNIRPLFDHVLVARSEAPQKTKSGLYIPNSASEKPSQGIVRAVGKGYLQDNGVIQPLQVSEGDTVVFGKYDGTEITVETDKLLILKEENILGIIEQ
jgi:chaperonin GroES